MLGVLGGMGPVATADFFAKLLQETVAQGGVAGDEDHVPVLLLSDPRIPPRPSAILEGTESPLPRLVALRDLLLRGGATFLAMPCNTAHYWYRALADDCAAPFLSIVDASLAVLPAGARRIAVVGTRATLQAQVFDAALAARGCSVLLPDEDALRDRVLPAIAQVKAGHAEAGGRMLQPAIEQLRDRGADAVLLACTELPLALDAIDSPLRAGCIDTTRALARACVLHWRENAPVGIAASA